MTLKADAPRLPHFLVVVSALLLLFLERSNGVKIQTIAEGSGQAAIRVQWDGSTEGDNNAIITTDDKNIVTRTGGVIVTSEMEGGLFQSLTRRVLAGEKMAIAKLRGRKGDFCVLAPSYPADVVVVGLGDSGEEEGLMVVKGACLAHEDSVKVTTTMEKNVFSRWASGSSGLTLHKCRGKGKVALTAFGSIISLDLKPGMEQVVKAGHVVAWSDGMKASMGNGLGMFSYGFKGPGTVYIRSHNPVGFRKWAAREKVRFPSLDDHSSDGKKDIVQIKEGLLKRTKRGLLRMLLGIVMTFVAIALLQAAQALLIEGPQGLKQVPTNLLRLLKGLQAGLLHLSRIAQRLYHEILKEAGTTSNRSTNRVVEDLNNELEPEFDLGWMK